MKYKSTILKCLMAVVWGGVISCTEVSDKQIVCWGDSLTSPNIGSFISGFKDRSFPGRLQSLIGDDYEVINAGVGGEDTRTIMGRQGCYPFLLAHDIIFDKNVNKKVIGTEDFPPFISSYDSMVVYPQLQGNGYMSPIIINGREYSLTCTAKVSIYDKKIHRNFAYEIERKEEIEFDDTLRKYSIVETEAMRSFRGKYAYIYFMGENDGFANVKELINQYQSMIKYSGSEKYLIISFHKTNKTIPTISRMEEMEDSLSKAFGSHYLNLRKSLINEGLTLSNQPSTVEDKAAINEGIVPPSLLMKDKIHFTKNTKEVVAKMVRNKLKELKYIE